MKVGAKKVPRAEGDELRQVTILLLESEIAWLKARGGLTRRIRGLIKEARWEEQGK